MSKNTILYDDVTTVLNQLLACPLPLAKERYYKENIYNVNFIQHKIYEDDEKICYVITSFRLCVNKTFYLKTKKSEGITFNKETKKVKIWLGTNVKSLNGIHNLYDYMGIDWIKRTTLNLNAYITKTTLEKILSKKITNQNELIAQIIKTSVKYKYDLESVAQFLNRPLYQNNSPISFLINIAKYTINPNESLRIINMIISKKGLLDDLKREKKEYDESFWEKDFPIKDLIGENTSSSIMKIDRFLMVFHNVLTHASFLDAKLNLKWSYKRLVLEYEKMSNALIDLKTKGCENAKVKYIGDLQLPYRTKLIDNSLEYLKEYKFSEAFSSTLFKDVLCRNKFVLKSDLHDRCTIVIAFDKRNNGPTLNVVGIKYLTVSQETIDTFNEWFSQKEVINFFNVNYHTELDAETIKLLEEKGAYEIKTTDNTFQMPF